VGFAQYVNQLGDSAEPSNKPRTVPYKHCIACRGERRFLLSRGKARRSERSCAIHQHHKKQRRKCQRLFHV